MWLNEPDNERNERDPTRRTEFLALTKYNSGNRDCSSFQPTRVRFDHRRVHSSELFPPCAPPVVSRSARKCCRLQSLVGRRGIVGHVGSSSAPGLNVVRYVAQEGDTGYRKSDALGLNTSAQKRDIRFSARRSLARSSERTKGRERAQTRASRVPKMCHRAREGYASTVLNSLLERASPG